MVLHLEGLVLLIEVVAEGFHLKGHLSPQKGILADILVLHNLVKILTSIVDVVLSAHCL